MLEKMAGAPPLAQQAATAAAAAPPETRPSTMRIYLSVVLRPVCLQKWRFPRRSRDHAGLPNFESLGYRLRVTLLIEPHRPRGTFRVRDLTTGAIIWRQAVTWHPAAGAGGGIPLAAATGGGIKGNENHSPQLEELAVRMGTLGAELGSEEQGASGESREIPEDIPLEPELPEELLEPPELPEMQLNVDERETGLGTLEDEELEPDWQAEQRDAPAALRKLRNSFTGNLHPVLPSRTRSGGRGGENESVGGGEGAGNDHALCCNVPA